MAEEKKGTQEPNPEEEEETSETSDAGEGEPLKNQEPSVEELEKQLKEYKARMEHHKKKQKELEAKLQELSKSNGSDQKKSEPQKDVNVLDLAKKVSALKDYAPDEIDFLEVIARGKGIDPVEALNTEEFKLFLEAKRQKVAQESKIPQPSTKQTPSQKGYADLTPEDVDKLPVDEKFKYFQWRKNQPPGSLKW